MQQQRTLVMLKPDVLKRGIVGKIISDIEGFGLKIEQIKSLSMNSAMISEFYQEHKEKKFFPIMEGYIKSDQVVAIIVSGIQAIQAMRKLIGNNDPVNAATNSIRSKFGISIDVNSIHASDSEEAAAREIKLIFGH